MKVWIRRGGQSVGKVHAERDCPALKRTRRGEIVEADDSKRLHREPCQRCHPDANEQRGEA